MNHHNNPAPDDDDGDFTDGGAIIGFLAAVALTLGCALIVLGAYNPFSAP